MANYIIAIDPALRKLGIAIFRNGKLHHVEALHTKSDGDARFLEVADRIEKLIDEYTPMDGIVIETQFMFRNSRTTIEITRMRGFLQGVFYTKTKKGRIINVTPREGKMVLGVDHILRAKKGKKGSSKDAVRQKVLLLYPEYKTASEDEIDAIAIGLAGIAKMTTKLSTS